MRRSVDFSSTHDLAESLAFEADKMNLTGASEDHRNAVSAFVDKEKPIFRGSLAASRRATDGAAGRWAGAT